QDLLDFMDALGIPGAGLAGYDWGGRAACIAAILAPERVRALVTIGGYNVQNTLAPSPPAPVAQERAYWYQWNFNTERGRARADHRARADPARRRRRREPAPRRQGARALLRRDRGARRARLRPLLAAREAAGGGGRAAEGAPLAMRIEVICTGDEVLTGKIVNTNFAFISQRLEDVGLSVAWETTVGDDRESLLRAFQLAGERADAVIVNGGLGPTVDDLSQEVAAQAAGVELALNDEWLTKMEDFFRRRSRVMPPNNRKQAMLPTTAEIIDNPIGTACGFAVDIGHARFFFTPGVPRELKRMLEEQIVPRLLAKSGLQTAIHLKRFHSYGLGESHVDALLSVVEALVPDGTVKLGFRAHYPQLETKLTARGRDMATI